MPSSSVLDAQKSHTRTLTDERLRIVAGEIAARELADALRELAAQVAAARVAQPVGAGWGNVS